jgi:hypothetical protein
MPRLAVMSRSAPLADAAGCAAPSRPRSRSLPRVHGFRRGITARSCCSFNFLAIRGGPITASCRMMGPRKGDAMARGERRKCKCCLKLVRPDPRNRRHQCYCSAPACRAASRAASQVRWLSSPENQSYSRGPIHVARVRAWRSRHPGY